MRGTVGGLASPYSFGALLPAVYQEDGFAMRMMAAFDEVLAPVVSTIDNVEHYFEPALAPSDLVEMLAWWVGVELDETWSDEARRELVAEAASLYRIRGTVAGLRRHVAIYAGVEPEIEESGACGWSSQPGSRLPGDRRPGLLVRVRVADPDSIDVRRLDRLVAASKPAHVPHVVEVVRAVAPEPAGEGGAAGPSDAWGKGAEAPGSEAVLAGEAEYGPSGELAAPGRPMPRAAGEQPAGEQPAGEAQAEGRHDQGPSGRSSDR